MQTCPECGKQTEGVDHNGRGLRCTFCFARLPVVETAAEMLKAAPAKEVEPEPEKVKGEKWPSRTSTRS